MHQVVRTGHRAHRTGFLCRLDCQPHHSWYAADRPARVPARHRLSPSASPLCQRCCRPPAGLPAQPPSPAGRQRSASCCLGHKRRCWPCSGSGSCSGAQQAPPARPPQRSAPYTSTSLLISGWRPILPTPARGPAQCAACGGASWLRPAGICAVAACYPALIFGIADRHHYTLVSWQLLQRGRQPGSATASVILRSWCQRADAAGRRVTWRGRSGCARADRGRGLSTQTTSLHVRPAMAGATAGQSRLHELSPRQPR